MRVHNAAAGTPPLIAWFDDGRQLTSELLGGKCLGLAEMTAAGLAVPPGFAVTTFAHRRILDPDLAPGSGAVEQAVGSAYAELTRRVGRPDPPVAVRSSGQSEDSQDASFAGQYDSYLWVTGADGVLDAVRRVWAGSLAGSARSYRIERHLGVPVSPMCVGVQLMVDARSAGVMFTLDPRTGDRSLIVIEASWGLGEAVVGGEVRPDRISVNKVTGAVTVEDIGTKEAEYRFDPDAGEVRLVPVEPSRRSAVCLSGDEVAELVRLASEIEGLRGAAQDVEWAIDRDGHLFLLQVRPETVWSARRESEGAGATQHRGALEYVVALLSGSSS
jgi:pyruvate,water dikinase